MNKDNINILVLAYLGDTIYEDYIRKYLIYKGIAKVEELQKESMNYVSAKSQARIVTSLMDNNVLTSEEIDIVKRARNAKVGHHPKSTDIITYKYATGLEALIGYLEINNNKDRIDEIMNIILGGNLC